MADWTIRHPALGKRKLTLTGDAPPEESDIWEAVKLTVDPEIMFKAHRAGGEVGREYAREAYKQGYFEGPGIGEGLKHIWELGKTGMGELATMPERERRTIPILQAAWAYHNQIPSACLLYTSDAADE